MANYSWNGEVLASRCLSQVNLFIQDEILLLDQMEGQYTIPYEKQK